MSRLLKRFRGTHYAEHEADSESERDGETERFSKKSKTASKSSNFASFAASGGAHIQKGQHGLGLEDVEVEKVPLDYDGYTSKTAPKSASSAAAPPLPPRLPPRLPPPPLADKQYRYESTPAAELPYDSQYWYRSPELEQNSSSETAAKVEMADLPTKSQGKRKTQGSFQKVPEPPPMRKPAGMPVPLMTKSSPAAFPTSLEDRRGKQPTKAAVPAGEETLGEDTFARAEEVPPPNEKRSKKNAGRGSQRTEQSDVVGKAVLQPPVQTAPLPKPSQRTAAENHLLARRLHLVHDGPASPGPAPPTKGKPARPASRPAEPAQVSAGSEYVHLDEELKEASIQWLLEEFRGLGKEASLESWFTFLLTQWPLPDSHRYSIAEYISDDAKTTVQKTERLLHVLIRCHPRKITNGVILDSLQAGGLRTLKLRFRGYIS